MSGLWTDHGTKLLGWFVVLVGAFGDCLVLFQQIDPKHAAIYTLVATLGGAIVKRGYTNSANAEQASLAPPPIPPKQQGAITNLFSLVLVCIGFLIVLCACQSLGIGPMSLDQKIAAADGTYAAVVNATASALEAGSLSSKDGESVRSMAKTARGFLDAAKQAEGAGNATAAQSELTLAASALSALQTYLNSHLPRK